MFDVLNLLWDHHMTVKEVCKELKITPKSRARGRVIKAIEEAFHRRIVKGWEEPTVLIGNLRARYRDVEFCLIPADQQFDDICALQVLRWIQGAAVKYDYEHQDVFVAVGGGEAMRRMTLRVQEVLHRHGDLRDWFSDAKSRLSFVNATAGGQPWHPYGESAYIAPFMAAAVGNAKVGVFSSSTTLSPEERNLISRAVSSRAIIVSGLGVPAPNAPAYCLEAMRDKGVIGKEMFASICGEFLYHPFVEDGRLIWDTSGATADNAKPRLKKAARDDMAQRRALLDVKERSLEASPEPGECVRPMFATLFDFEGLKGRPAKAYVPKEAKFVGAERCVIGVVKDSTSTLWPKAKALRTLLSDDSKMFSKLVISTDMARAILAP